MASSFLGLQATLTGWPAGFGTKLSLGAILSLAILVPCFWQRHIQSTDLPSHLYNASLYTQVIEHRLPGLVVVHQNTNIVVDELLARTMRWWGPLWAERSVVGLSVLVFFWGAFRFITALTGTSPWRLAPFLAMLAYGAVFRWGLLNFYLSLGLCLWAAAFAWNRRVVYWICGTLLWGLALRAHAMSPVWIAAVLLYFFLVARLDQSKRIWVFGLSIVAIVVGSLALRHWAHGRWPDFREIHHFRLYAGFLALGTPYGTKYWGLSGLVLLLWAPYALRKLGRSNLRSVFGDIFVQLVLLHIITSILTPELIDLPGYSAGFSLITVRLSLYTALCILLWITKLNPPIWHTVALIGIAALFFSFQYADERAVNKVEERIEAAVSQLPAGQRVIAVLYEAEPEALRELTNLVDRPCIGHCFDYSNFEPSTGQFRLRANQANAYVLSNAKDVDEVEAGTYVARNTDIPLYQIRLCVPSELRFCVEPVSPGQSPVRQELRIQPKFWRSPLVH